MARFLSLIWGNKPGILSVWTPLKGRRFGAWIALVFVIAALLVSISPGVYVRLANIKVGQVWLGPTVASPYTFIVKDEEAANRQRKRILEQHPRVFRFDSRVEQNALSRLQKMFAALVAARNANETTSAVQKKILETASVRLQPETVESLMANAANERIISDLTSILRHLFSNRGISDDKNRLESSAREGRMLIYFHPAGQDSATTISAGTVLEYPREAFSYLEQRHLPMFSLSPEMFAAYLDIAKQLIRPNIVYDDDQTRLARNTALMRMNPEQVVEEGEPVIRTGEMVTPIKARQLSELAAREQYYNILRIFGAAVFVVFAAVFIALYAKKYLPELAFNASNVLMISLPVIFALSAGRLALNAGPPSISAAYAFPAGMIGMLGVIFFEARFALVLVTIAAMLFGLATGLDYRFILVSLVGGFTGVASLYTIKERKEVLLAGLRLALVNALTILSVTIISNPDEFSLNPAVGGILNGLGCYILTLAALPFFEMIFGVTTDVRLMELTSTNHPLLRELEDKAPGSLQHSLNVAKLAESAAEDVSAHILLVRAGAYFHDIGKTIKPKYYTENQTTPEERRIHSKLSPYMSNLIIKNHVKDGIELAREHHLPEKVVDFIPQHHGTSLIKFFYAQAMQRAEENDLVREEEFRYPGPKPQTIETAIVMLADTVDATATAKFANGKLDDEDDLRKIVRDAIRDKFDDEQFDECHMTFSDLHIIQESFVRTLMSRFHRRIDYPKMEKRDPAKEGPKPVVKAAANA